MKAQMEKTSERHLVVDDLEVMCIPKRYYMATIDSIKNNVLSLDISKYVESVIDGRALGAGLLLKGKVSTGKTYAACAVLKRLKVFVPVFRGMFVDVTCISDEYLKSEFMGEGMKISDRMLDVDLLVLDDIGSEKKFEHERIFDIFKQRCNDLKRTIVTTNFMDRMSFEKHFGIYGKKFWEMIVSCCLVVEFPQDNLRIGESDKLRHEIVGEQ